MKRSGLRFEHFCYEVVLNWQNNIYIYIFFGYFSLQNMVETTLPDGLENSGQSVYR